MDTKIPNLPDYTTPLDADNLIVDDTSNAITKKTTWANIKATLVAYFNAIYATLASPTFTGTVTIPSPFNVDSTSVTTTGAELNNVAGTTSAIQTQLDAKIPKSLVDAKGDIIIATDDNTVTRLPVGNNGQALVADSAQSSGVKWGDVIQSADVQVFTASGTWTKPTGAKTVEVYVAGGGGGGGSGARQTSPASYSGGSGGGGGSLGYKIFNALGLGTTETVTIGAGGAGGLSRTGSNQLGQNGSDGGVTIFGTTSLLKSNGGIKGIGGDTNSNLGGVGGVVGNGDFTVVGGNGGTSRTDSSAGNSGDDTATFISPRGGGAGGGYNVSPTAQNGGVGGGFITNYIKAGGATGTIGNSSITLFYGGTGGGGGNAGSTGSAGGSGIDGSGGGGGGTATSTSGAGGKGGDGFCIVVSYF